MPHAVEMPSFLADDTGQMLSHNCPPFDLPSHLRHSHEKANGARTSSHTSIKGSLGDGSEAYVDGGSVGRLQANGDMLHDANLNSLPNGRSSPSSWEQQHKSSRNPSSVGVNGGVNGATAENGRSPVAPQNGVARVSNGGERSSTSTNGDEHDTTTIEPTTPTATTNGDSGLAKELIIPPPVSTNPQSTGPLTYTSSLLPATLQTTDSPAKDTSPSAHRFSSPPLYSPVAPSPSANSLSHPGSAQLKHRHTLQVPKLGGMSRNSRDGEDAMFSSGRFSPTSLAVGVRRGSLSLNRRNTQSIHSNMQHEEILQDENAMRWAEAVRQKRASKRRRRDEEEDDRVVVGIKVDQNHVNWVTAYNMLTGIRFTVSRTNAKMDRPLTDVDFEARHKFSFDM